MTDRYVRVAAAAEGSDLGVPVGWTVFDRTTGRAVSFEPNPAYVPPPEPTETDLLLDELRDLEERLLLVRVWLCRNQDQP